MRTQGSLRASAQARASEQLPFLGKLFVSELERQKIRLCTVSVFKSRDVMERKVKVREN